MDAEGMVHALEQVAGLLKPAGVLVDIHPSQDPPLIEVVSASDRFPAGLLQETDDFIEYRQADNALAQVQSLGWFKLEEASGFPFTIHASSLGELRNFLADKWKDAVIPQESIEEIEAIFAARTDPDLEIVITEFIVISRFRPGHKRLSKRDTVV